MNGFAIQTRKGTAQATSDTAIVYCANVRCLGLRGEDGVWRDAYGNVLNVVRIVSEI